MKLKIWLEEWLEKYVRDYVKYKTYWLYENYCRIHIEPCLGECLIENLDIEALQEFVHFLLTRGNRKNNKGLATSTVHGIMNVLKLSYIQAKKMNLVTKDFPEIKLPEISERQVECFSKVEQQQIESLIARNQKPNNVGILICLYTGIRLGELLALTPSDVDLKKRILNINKTVAYIKKDGKYKFVVEEPKTKSSVRCIPLSDYMIEILKRHLKKVSKKNYLLCTKNGTMITNRSYQKSFECILTKLHLKHKGFHSLRHTFATRAVESGMDFKTLSEILGHDNPLITAKRYSHSLLSHKLELLNKMTLHCRK